MTTALPEKHSTIVGKDELVHQIAAKSGLNLKETTKVIDAFTEVVCEDVAQGHEVRLMGFGTWNLRQVAARNVKSIRGGNSCPQTCWLLRRCRTLTGCPARKAHIQDQDNQAFAPFKQNW